MKINSFFKKHGIFVIIAFVILLLLFAVLVLLLRDKDGYTIDPDTGLPIPSADLTVVKQPLGYHKNYQISFSPLVVEELEELEYSLYASFDVKDVDHFSWVEKFVNDLKGFSFKYNKVSPTPEFIHHYWEDGDNSVSYNFDRDSLFFTSPQGFSLPGINFDSSDVDKLEKALSKLSSKYFSSKFEYSVKEVVREGNDYRVNFSRTLLSYPVYVDMQEEYLVFTPDGRLKSGLFLLAEFSERNGMSYPLTPARDLVSKISTMEYPKEVKFFNLDPSIEDKYEPYGYQAYSNPFLQTGNINVDSFELIYLYSDRSQKISVPTFLFDGKGTLSIEGKSSQADFVILSNALSSKYVFVESPSFFRQLESVK
jgi:hypothetical protein